MPMVVPANGVMFTPAVKPTPQSSPSRMALGAFGTIPAAFLNQPQLKYSTIGPAATDSQSFSFTPTMGLKFAVKILEERE